MGIASDSKSRLIGMIYDSVIDPENWDGTLQALCDEFDFLHAVLGYYHQPIGSPFRPRLRITTRLDPFWLERQNDFGPEMVSYWGGPEALQSFPIDEPIVSHAVQAGVAQENRFVREWLGPQGIVQLIGSTLVRNPHFIASVVFSRHARHGCVGEGELDVLRELGPHLRRALEISNLLDIRTIEAKTFEATLELIASGVILVDEDCRLVHANGRAREMIATRDPLHVVDGRLMLSATAATAALVGTVVRCAHSEHSLGQRGIGIPILSALGNPVVVRVLPLNRGDLRTRLVQRAVAAVFIAPVSTPPQMPGDALTLLYDLTPAEIRVLELLLEGNTPTQIGVRLGVKISTVKTHLKHAYQKTGTQRQVDLLRLLMSLSPTS